MNPSVESLQSQVESVNQQLPGLVAGLSAEAFNWSPGPGRWSVGRCGEHLNITTERDLPSLAEAVFAQGRRT